MLTDVAPIVIMPDVTDWLSITEASKESEYSPLWLRELIRDSIKHPEAEPPFEFERKGNMYLLEPKSFRAYCERMKRLGRGKFDPTRKNRKR